MIQIKRVIVVRWLTASAFAAVGTLHFVRAALFARIVPPIFPHPQLLVHISGVCEIAGGIGLLIPPLRRPAAWGLLALLVAVFPANIYMAVDPGRFADLHLPLWLIWLRLPMQAIFAWDVRWVGLGLQAGTEYALEPFSDRPEGGAQPGPTGRR